MEMSTIEELWLSVLVEGGVSKEGVEGFKEVFDFLLRYDDERTTFGSPLIGTVLVGCSEAGWYLNDFYDWDISCLGLNLVFYETLRYIQDSMYNLTAKFLSRIFGLSEEDLNAIKTIQIEDAYNGIRYEIVVGENEEE